MGDDSPTMGTPTYYFDRFCLNPLTRELSRDGETVDLSASAFDCLVYLVEHRERPVGRDELISAAWGRADVSDSVLAQTIVRVRRALDDTGHEQRYIKTVPRVGYRWIADVAVTFQEPVAEDTDVAPIPVDASHAAEDVAGTPSRRKPGRFSPWIALLFALAAVGSYWGWRTKHPAHSPAILHFDQSAAVVLPTEVDAPEDWKWLRLGLMDLIATQLRDANVPTENSQDVLNLLNHADTSAEVAFSAFVLAVRSHVTLTDSTWHVDLEAKSKDGRSWHAESSSSDVLGATHTASNLLLAQLGYAAAPARQNAGNTQQEYLLRVVAAQLAGQPQLAQQLIDAAPADLHHTPELSFARAQLDCDEGKLDLCEQTLLEAAKQASAAGKPVLRAKALTGLWYFYNRKHQFAEGEAALNEAVNILQGQKDVEALATAYLDRSHLEFFHDDVDEAAEDLGRARISYTLAGDSVGQAKVDFALGMIANRRGQFEQAVPLLESAYEQYQRMGVKVLLIAPLDDLALAHRMLLQFPDELAATDRFWPLDPNLTDDYVRHQLTITRAIALADNGRTLDAKALLEQLLGTLNAAQEADLAADANAWLAKLALGRGDAEEALARIAKAMAGAGFDQIDDKRGAADAWLVNVTALQRTGKVKELQSALSAMQAWASKLPDKDAWIDTRLAQAKAADAWSEGNRDQALAYLNQAVSSADKSGVPELIVSAGQSYAAALLRTGHADQALAISGRLSTWIQVDWRAAWVAARVYQALGRSESSQQALNKARELAGDRLLPTPSTSDFY
jgi:DNA-binding winged helix-turn-helix (wHTH) protein/tetratricopeptide (TPR) repeat protein